MSTPAATHAPAHPLRELLSRYRDAFRAAWAARVELAGPARLAEDAAFLPAALSMQETPPHPAPRRLALAVCALFVIALAWAIVGRIDIVAVASGRVIVSDRSKTIQPLEASVVRRVFVKDGDLVKAGQVLVELDGTNAAADQAAAREQLQAATAEAIRTAALLQTIGSPRLPTAAAPGDDDPQWLAERQDIAAKLSKLAAERARRDAERMTVQALIAKLEATLPIARQRETDIKSLVDQGFMSSHAGQDRSRERIEQERDLATQHARLAEAHAALAEADRARAAFLAETQRTLNDRRAQALLKAQQLTQELSKTEHRNQLAQLTAPVDGTVQQLAIHTEGGVVTPAQPLMVIVPIEAAVTAEVVIENKDIGFVRAGQNATIKMETFAFTRYGTIDATVIQVSADAVPQEKLGTVFPATLRLAKNHIDIDGQRVTLSPGLNLSAEIKTGQRRVIDFLLDPVRRASDESLRER